MSPNVRMKEDTIRDFRNLQNLIQLDLEVGPRAVSANTLIAAMLAECNDVVKGERGPAYLSLLERLRTMGQPKEDG